MQKGAQLNCGRWVLFRDLRVSTKLKKNNKAILLEKYYKYLVESEENPDIPVEFIECQDISKNALSV